jgi:uncharacterized protein YecA (UPF0149 family)
MTKIQAKKIFEQYNPASGIARCPKGRAKMRKPLDLYAKAAVNLYGIISLKEFTGIFNAQNEEQTTADEVFTILLPNVHKYGWYGFYKDYLVHYVVLHNFDWVSFLEREQADKPRYIPEKDLFLEYEWEEYDDFDHWKTVLEFMLEAFGGTKNTVEGYQEMKNYIMHSIGIKETGKIMEKYNLVCSSEEQFHEFIHLIILANNNTRKWENSGHTPEELIKFFADKRPKEPVVNQPRKVGLNQRCPCGSGKKYKHCCKLIENEGTAQLSFSERKLFYETWYKLLNFINQKYSILNIRIEPVYPAFYDESQLYKIREKLWERPGIIGEFISSTNSLSGEEIDLLRSWEDRHIKGWFLLLKYESEYAIFMRGDKGEEPKLYAVKGMTSSIAGVMRRQLPVMLDTVLLPFGDKIIYDSFMASHALSFGDGVKDLLNEDYAKSKDIYGIITTLR